MTDSQGRCRTSVGSDRLLMIGVSLTGTPAQTLGLTSLPAELSSDGSTMISTLQQIGAAVGTAIGASLLAAGQAAGDGAVGTAQGAQWGCVFCAAAAAVALVLALSLRGRQALGPAGR